MSYPTHDDARRELQRIRNGRYLNEETGRPAYLPKWQIEVNVTDFVLKHLQARGRFFRNEGTSYYVDRVEHRLYPVGPDGSGLRPLLADLNLEWKGSHTSVVANAIATRAGDADQTPEIPIHRLTYCDGKRSYIYQSPRSMLRISATGIDEVPLGKDGVILISDLGDLPSLSDLQPLIDEIRPRLGDTCVRLRPDLPLTQHLTTRWSRDAYLSHDDLHQMFLTRVLFMGVASLYPTWPLTVTTGPGGSGKSTASEMLTAMFSGSACELPGMPGKQDNFEVNISNCTLAMYDNADRAGLDKPANEGYADVVCGLATGQTMTRRVLYTTMDQLKFRIRRHTFISSCVYPFPPGQTDVMRRVIAS